MRFSSLYFFFNFKIENFSENSIIKLCIPINFGNKKFDEFGH